MTAELDKDMKRALRNLEVRLIVSDSLGVELQVVNCVKVLRCGCRLKLREIAAADAAAAVTARLT